VRINLPEGTTYEALCDSINASTTFHLISKAIGLDKHVRPGSYVVEPHMNTIAMVRKLRNGQQDPIRLTIGKFRTPQQLNEYLNTKLMHDDFDVPLDSFHIILPDTYEFYWTVTPEQFMQRMRKEYDKFWLDEVGANGEHRFELLSMSDFIPDIRLANIKIVLFVPKPKTSPAHIAMHVTLSEQISFEFFHRQKSPLFYFVKKRIRNL
jgi:hypothetical protein